MEKREFEDFISELKQKNDIVSVASKYVQVERKGRYFWCRCPFHGEKTPSCCLNDIDNFFYCYGCHVGGNVITFVKLIESLDFVEAIKLMAQWANMEVPSSIERSRNGEDVALAKKRKERLISLMKETAMHYVGNLSKPCAATANEYIKRRQLDGNTQKHFGIGYSVNFGALPEFLREKGYTNEEMLACGVVKQKDGGKLYDPLANRVVFPIIDIYGNVIAFGGRTMESNPQFAKYLNTAETELFNKRNTLYAINYLKKQRQNGPIPYVIVVEGYMDTISLHKAGFTMTVASMGTALTQSQAKMIKRFADKVYICYDGDAAGQNATLRGLDILKENGLDVMVVQLPDKFDPDDVIKTYGREGYQKILNEALPLVEFKLKYLKNKFDLSNVDGRVKYLNEAIEVLSGLSSVEQELYTLTVSEIAMTNVDFIKRELSKKLDGKPILNEIRSKFAQNKPVENNEDIVAEETVSPVVVKAEKYVLCAIIHKKPYAFFKTDITYLFSGARREIYKLICDTQAKSPSVNLVDALFDFYAEGNQSMIADIINYNAESNEDEENEKRYYQDCLWVIYKNYLEIRLKELTDEYSGEVDNLRRKELSQKMIEIHTKLKTKKVDEL